VAFKTRQPDSSVNNDIYDQYGERWYTAKDDPVALLRAEARARYQWIIAELRGRYSDRSIRILDVGCGAGFLANALALSGYLVTGVDLSKSTLEVAQNHDSTKTVDYRYGNAYNLEFEDGAFNVVCAMDFLEHVEYPEKIVHEVARVLKPGGLFFFYTFNRNFLAWLIVIKGVEWFIRNTPHHMHRLHYFVKPAEMRRMCCKNRMSVVRCRGLAPKIFQTAFWKMLVTGSVDDSFAFAFTGHNLLGYMGLAVRGPDERAA
jgi:2-polyprenyl-6-hydroxyphenyl methylase/3-demethylubiquinone-9 3-methyltransferase